MMPDDDPMAVAGYAPCADLGTDPAVPVQCPGRAWPTAAVWIAPGLLLATYGVSDCWHTAETVFVLTIPEDAIANDT